MEWTNEWIERGRSEGLRKGAQEVLLRQLKRRFRSASDALVDRVRQLSEPEVDELADAMFDFQQVSDVERWLSARAATV